MDNARLAKRLLGELGLTQAMLAALVNKNPATMSLWLRGAYYFPMETESEILHTLEDIKALVASLPFAMDLNEIWNIRDALDAFRAKRAQGKPLLQAEGK